MLIYRLPATRAIYQRFVGIDGSAYFIGGLGMTALTANEIVVVPIRSGLGLRLGANIGYSSSPRSRPGTRSSAPFPKFVIHRGTPCHELRKQRGTSKCMILSATYRFEVPERACGR